MRLFTLLLATGLLLAGEAWNTKDPAQWSSEEIDRILTNSPWAKSVKVAFDGARSGQSGQSGGRSSGRIGLPGGIGFPGGGVGFPGGGTSRRSPSPGGTSGDPGRGPAPSSVLVRWESALPVQQALERLDDKPPAAKSGEDSSAKRYVITVFGLRGGFDQDSGQSDLRRQLISATRLVIKGKRSLSPEDVQFNPTGLSKEIRFIFPANETVSPDDKEISFETRTGEYRVETKFRPKNMTYKGRLEL